MLGMGDDGHTASLFPETHALHVTGRLAVANFLPKKDIWRLTFTYECISQASHPTLYVFGAAKAPMVETVLKGPYTPDHYPVQKVGTIQHPALWILDKAAAQNL